MFIELGGGGEIRLYFTFSLFLDLFFIFSKEQVVISHFRFFIWDLLFCLCFGSVVCVCLARRGCPEGQSDKRPAFLFFLGDA